MNNNKNDNLISTLSKIKIDPIECSKNNLSDELKDIIGNLINDVKDLKLNNEKLSSKIESLILENEELLEENKMYEDKFKKPNTCHKHDYSNTSDFKSKSLDEIKPVLKKSEKQQKIKKTRQKLIDTVDFSSLDIFLENYFNNVIFTNEDKLTSNTIYEDYQKYKDCNTDISIVLFRMYTVNSFIRKHDRSRYIIGYKKIIE